jgi:hypothetical protein
MLLKRNIASCLNTFILLDVFLELAAREVKRVVGYFDFNIYVYAI